ncbi:MAG: fimbrial protein [Enterobacteriaceae bacterium]
MKKSALIVLLFALFSIKSLIAGTESGTIKFIGNIINAPCSVAPETVEQTVRMALRANAVSDGRKKSPRQAVNIRLEGCTEEIIKSATVTIKDLQGRSNNLTMKASQEGRIITVSGNNHLPDPVSGDYRSAAHVVINYH